MRIRCCTLAVVVMAETGSREGARPKQERSSCSLPCYSCFSVLFLACSALAPFPSQFQWLLLYSAHIGAL
jgi:hypothetical protein